MANLIKGFEFAEQYQNEKRKWSELADIIDRLEPDGPSIIVEFVSPDLVRVGQIWSHGYIKDKMESPPSWYLKTKTVSDKKLQLWKTTATEDTNKVGDSVVKANNKALRERLSIMKVGETIMMTYNSPLYIKRSQEAVSDFCLTRKGKANGFRFMTRSEGNTLFVTRIK